MCTEIHGKLLLSRTLSGRVHRTRMPGNTNSNQNRFSFRVVQESVANKNAWRAPKIGLATQRCIMCQEVRAVG